MTETTAKPKAGRPSGAETVRGTCAKHARAAASALAAIAVDASAPAHDRIDAARVLLAHATNKVKEMSRGNG